MPALDVRQLLKQARDQKKACSGLSAFDTASSLATSLIEARIQNRLPLNPAEDALSPVLEEVLYVPDFVTADEEIQLLTAIEAAPAGRWTQAGERQMQNWGGRPGEAVVRERLPPFLQGLVDLLVAAGVYESNQAPQHVLVNSYKGGAGIGAHMDGPLYSACVATITLGGPALMQFHAPTAKGSAGAIVAEVLLQPRCLLVMQDAACNALLHSIQSQPADTISDMCVNAQTAQVEVGQVIHRSRRRMSLVFVHKQHAQWMC